MVRKENELEKRKEKRVKKIGREKDGKKIRREIENIVIK